MGRFWRLVTRDWRCEGFPGLAGAFAAILLLVSGSPVATAAGPDARLKQAAQHFADLEDDKAKAILEDLSAEGLADADVLLGYLYADPLHEGRDYKQAVGAFGRAAASGNEEALFQLAESRFWPEYSNWTLTTAEEALRPSPQRAFELLRGVAGKQTSGFKGHKASKWRLAHLCTFGGYDCGDDVTDEAIEMGRRIAFDNLRAISASFHIIADLRSGEAEESGSMRGFDPYLALGYADVDPHVAAAATAPVWRDLTGVQDCPSVDEFLARGRFLAERNGLAGHYTGSLGLEDCFSSEQLESLEVEAVASLDYLARVFDNDTRSWHLRRCYHEREAPSFGDCLLAAVHHHFFACTKLSIPAFYKRFKIEYRLSKRYEECREMMLGYPLLLNKI